MHDTPETPAVRLVNASKGYRQYSRSSDRLREIFFRQQPQAIHWALQDVSLEIASGETFGLVGENGAGKSSILKLVAGTTRPTSGQVLTKGKVAALLELGAGFHPEDSGRDNIHLMGALAGIPRAEIPSYYAEIAAFSELSEEVLARPVKTYSSGMFMRLGFATATAVNPEVLIVDEALSVGDMHFQKKSLDRIMEFRDQGKTVLFCSHNLYQIRSLCSRAAWIRQGRIEAIGDAESVVTAYENYERAKDGAGLVGTRLTDALRSTARSGSSLAPVKILDVGIGPTCGAFRDQLTSFSDVSVAVDVESYEPDKPYHLGVAIVRNDKMNVFGTSTHFDPERAPYVGAGRRRVSLRFPRLPLLSGEYRLSVYVLDDTGLQVFDQAELICPFTVFNPAREFGMVSMPCEWIDESTSCAS